VYRGFYYRNYAMIFRFDPQGNQVLVSDVQISDYVSSQNYYNIYRSSYSTVSSSAATEAVRLRRGDYGWTTSFLGLNNFYRNTYGENDSRKDQTYSLIDGLDEETWTIIEPFDVVIGVSTPLEAPTPSISDTLGVSPLDVAAPETTTPDVGGEVAPPTLEGETTQPTEEPTGENTPSTQSLDPNAPLPAISALPGIDEDGTTTPVPNTDGLVPPVPGQGDVNTQDLGTLPGLGTLPTPTDPNQLPPATGEAIPLETSENTLPESLSGTNPSDVTLPTDALPSTGEITPPTGVTPPPVGATPSDSPLEVTIPEGLNPTVPPIEGTASPLEVAPPEGWNPQADIDIGVFGFVEEDDFQDGYANDLEDLEDAIREIERRQADELGRQQILSQFADAQRNKLLAMIDTYKGRLGGTEGATQDSIEFAYATMQPEAFIRFVGDIGSTIAIGVRPQGFDIPHWYCSGVCNPEEGSPQEARDSLRELGEIAKQAELTGNPELANSLYDTSIPYEYWSGERKERLMAMNLIMQMTYTTINEGLLGMMFGRLPRGKSIVGVGSNADNIAGSVGETGAESLIQFERLKASYAADEIANARPVGSALREDIQHQGAFWAQPFAENGKVFTIRGGDNKLYTLTQVEGEFNGQKGVYEWIVNQAGELTHQRFILDGVITGFANQVPSKLPK
jgi:hypothetical protein